MPFRQPKSTYADLRASISRSGGASLLDSGRHGAAAVGTDAAPPSGDPSPAPSASPPPPVRASLLLGGDAPVVAPAATAPDDPAPASVLAQLEPVAAVSPPSAPAAPRPGAPPRAAKAGERVRISVTARYPAEGHSKTFDTIAAVYGVHQAMRIVVRKALDAYEATPGPLPSSPTPPGYPAREGRLSSTRQIDGAVYEATRRIVDPLGLLPVRAVDTLLVTAALTAFFDASDRG